MFEAEEIFREFSYCSDYISRLIYIKENSKILNTQFVELVVLHAKIFLDDGEIPLAVELADLAIMVSSTIEDNRFKTSSIILKSQLLQLQSDHSQAEELLLEAEKIYSTEKTDDKLCDLYNLIAHLYKSQKKYEEAIEYYKKAIDLSEKLNKKDLYALNLSAIGEIEYHRNRTQQALWYFEQSLNTYRSLGEIKSQVQILNWMGYININLKIYEEALGNFLEVVNLLVGDNDEINSSVAYAKFHLGIIYQFFNEPDKGLKYFIEAVTIWKKREQMQAVSEMNFYCGRMCDSGGNKDLALDFYKKSLRLLQKLSSKKGMLSLLFQIRSLEEEDLTESIQSYFVRQLKKKPEEVELKDDNYIFDIISPGYRELLYRDEGTKYFNLGRPSFVNKLNIDLKKENQRKNFTISHSHLSIAFRQIASIYYDKEMYKYGFPYLIELLQIKKKIYNPQLIVQLIDGLKEISCLPDYEKNYTYYLQEIIRFVEKFVSKNNQALVFYEIGLMNFIRDEYEKADTMFLKSLTLCSSLRNRPLEARVYRAIAWSAFNTGDMVKSIDLLQKALKIDETLKLNDVALDLLLLGRVFLEKKDLAPAIEYQLRARSKWETVISSIDPLIFLRNLLLKSGTYYQLRFLYRILAGTGIFPDLNEKYIVSETCYYRDPHLNDIMKDESLIFDRLTDNFSLDNIDRFAILSSKKIPSKFFENFFSHQFMALIKLYSSKNHEATNHIISALKKLLDLPVRKEEKIFLFRLGLMYQTLELSTENRWHLRLADEYFRDFISDNNVKSPFSQRGIALFNLSILLGLRGCFSEALAVLVEAEDIEQIEKKYFRLARIYYQKGIIREYEEAIPEAIKNYNNALKVFRSVEDRAGIARCLNKLAILQVENRRDYLLEALSLLEGYKEPLMYGQIIFNWATVLRKEGNFLWESLDAFKESLKYFRKAGFPQCTVRSLHSLATLLLDLGQEEQSSVFLEEAWMLLKKRMPDVIWDRIRYFILMGQKEETMKKEEEALAYLQKVVFCTPSIPSSPGYSYWIYLELANFFSLMGEQLEKEKYQELAREIKRHILSIWGNYAFLYEKDPSSQLKQNFFDIIDEEDSMKDKTGNLKDSILPILHYLINLKDQENLLRRYTSDDIITDMGKNQ